MQNRNSLSLTVDFSQGFLLSLKIDHTERLAKKSPLFQVMVRDSSGHRTLLSPFNTSCRKATAHFGEYGGLHDAVIITVALTLKEGEAAWQLSAQPKRADLLIEWMDGPLLNLPSLKGQSHRLLIPYNEGVIIEDEHFRQNRREPEYPSLGSDFIFPNMLFAQMMAYLWEDQSLYIGAHDPARGVKGLDYEPNEEGVQLRLRIYCGCDLGQSFSPKFPILWAAEGSRWEDSAERYRRWFEQNLPPKAKKISENSSLPQWYADSPLVVSYPIRGWHDTDEMAPNALYPYCNALPLLEKIAKEAESRLLILLMHWEGTAPWAPPYVWPPFGGEEPFFAFRDALHKKNHLLGVYCSGFGYTEKSNLTDYEGADPSLHMDGFCADEKGTVHISKICTKQREGYDICPASAKGKQLLQEAYQPLFESGIDYAQILDQNHGGGQYFCLSPHHGHPPAAGPWMTKNMQELLSQWNQAAPHMLFGCESAAAEPFIGNLLFSDNRFELNFKIGKAVPLYAYLYHEYLRNFMGNQVSCPFLEEVDSLPWRIGYSFAAGDCLTLVLSPDGRLFSRWGSRDLAHPASWENSLTLIRNLLRFYREQAKPFLLNGKMIPALSLDCPSISFPSRTGEAITLPALHTSAWQTEDGQQAQILVNPTPTDQIASLGGKEYTIPALNAIII